MRNNLHKIALLFFVFSYAAIAQAQDNKDPLYNFKKPFENNSKKPIKASDEMSQSIHTAQNESGLKITTTKSSFS